MDVYTSYSILLYKQARHTHTHTHNVENSTYSFGTHTHTFGATVIVESTTTLFVTDGLSSSDGFEGTSDGAPAIRGYRKS